MARRICRFGGDTGGIARLALIMRDNADALDFDLMTMTGRTLDEYADMGAAGTVALVHFVKHLGPEAALWRALHPDDEMPDWQTRRQTNAILADIHDELAMARRENAVKGTGKRPRRIKPYPRPNAKAKDGRRIGSEAIKIRDFDKWWNSAA